MLRGKDIELALSKPGEGASFAFEAVRRVWRRAGFVDSEYEPGRRRTSVCAFGADNFVPTKAKLMERIVEEPSNLRVVFEYPCKHWPGTQTTAEELDWAAAGVHRQ
jgi:hypothetical protein